MTKNVESAEKETDSGIHFAALTGKLKIEWSVSSRLATVSVGEVNIYKLSSAVAGGVAVCKGLDRPKFDECAKAALTILKKLATEQMELKSADSKETKSGPEIPH